LVAFANPNNRREKRCWKAFNDRSIHLAKKAERWRGGEVRFYRGESERMVACRNYSKQRAAQRGSSRRKEEGRYLKKTNRQYREIK